MRWEQCCESQDCTKPAHQGALCAACFLAATPARRAVELLAAEPPNGAGPIRAAGYVNAAGVTWLERLWAA